MVDSINNNPGKILDEIARPSAILYPEEIFQFSITEKSKAVLNEQIRKHQLIVRPAIERSEYSLIKYELDQLKYLSELLRLKDIAQIYDECIRTSFERM